MTSISLVLAWELSSCWNSLLGHSKTMLTCRAPRWCLKNSIFFQNMRQLVITIIIIIIIIFIIHIYHILFEDAQQWNFLAWLLCRTPSLLNWIKIEPALTPTRLSLWPPEIRTHSQPPSSPRLITFRCLRLASTDTFNLYPAHKSPLILLFTMEGPTKAFRGCTFLVGIKMWNFLERT